jgi:hypothetical protein
MKRKTKVTGEVKDIYARHKSLHSNYNIVKARGTYRPAYMTLWALTDQEDEVWVETRRGLDSRRVETKVEEFEKEYAFLIGKTISYTLSRDKRIGFLREVLEEEK